MVKFDRPVQVGSRTLQAGEYTIQQVTSASNPRVLEFTSNNGSKLETTVTAIPIMQNTVPTETKVMIEDEGGGARLARIWVQGKTYGYEFPGKAAVAAQSAQTTLEAKYESQRPTNTDKLEVAQNQNASPAPSQSQAGSAGTESRQTDTTPADTTHADTIRADASRAETTRPDTTRPDTTRADSTRPNTATADATTPAAPAAPDTTAKPAPQQEPSVIAQAKPQEAPTTQSRPSNDSNAVRQDTPTMPITALGWLPMILIGVSLTVSSGLILYWLGQIDADQGG